MSSNNSKEKKWNNAYQDVDIAAAAPSQILQENAFLLSNTGDALDLACGRAGNSIYLAKRGYDVDAIDNSQVVLEQVREYADAERLPINCIKRDVENQGLNSKQYDIIIVSFFLYREISDQIIHALKPKGLLFYQTWSQLQCDKAGPNNPNFRLESGELLKLFSALTPVVYHEHGLIGNLSKGLRNQTMLIAQKN